MNSVSKFIPMDGNSGFTGPSTTVKAEGAGYGGSENANSTFRVCGSENASSSNLPAKTSFWSKLKGILTHEIKVELTPYEQKIEDEINEFLHQEVTWQSFKNFLFQDISFGKKSSVK